MITIKNPRREILRLLQERTRFYKQSRITIATDGKTPLQIVGRIIHNI